MSVVAKGKKLGIDKVRGVKFEITSVCGLAKISLVRQVNCRGLTPSRTSLGHSLGMGSLSPASYNAIGRREIALKGP